MLSLSMSLTVYMFIWLHLYSIENKTRLLPKDQSQITEMAALKQFKVKIIIFVWNLHCTWYRGRAGV